VHPDPIDNRDAETFDATPDELGPPVDPQPRPNTFFDATLHAEGNRRAVVPAALRNPDQRRDLARSMAKRVGHTAAYHAVRTPKYAAKTAWYAPQGLWRILTRLLLWARAEEGNYQLRQMAALRNDPDTWMKLDARRQHQASWRWWVVGAGALLLAVAVLVLFLAAPAWAPWLALVVVVPVLARLGRPVGKPITDRVITGPRFIKLTADMTRAALVACGAGIKVPGDVQFPRDIYRDPPGWTAIVNLPPGLIAADVIDRRDRLAAGFRLPKSQVWPAPVEGEHPGQLRIWVADRPVSAMRQPAWPLLRDGTVDYFRPIPYGFDERMRLVTWSLDQKNSLFGGIPGSGKSLAVRVVLLGAILDPLVIPVVFELKGTGDFDAIEPLCPKGLYGSGADEGTKEQAFGALSWLAAECDRRGPIVKQLAAAGMSRTNNVNRAMAERDPRVRPIVAVFDEVQELFADKELGKAAVATATSVVKRGRALGIHLILATQRIDKESIPRGISSNVAVRACLAVNSHVEVDLVLGTGAYSRGARPTEFETATDGDPKDSGWAYRAGLGPVAPVRAAYVDNEGAKQVAARALQARAGTVPVAVKVNIRNLVADVKRVWPAEVTGWWLADILAALQQLDEAYLDMDAEALSAALRATGVKPVPIHRKIEGKGVTRHGVQLADLQAALDTRTEPLELED
jgi:S-DNA-T family DNA segregation ATPase FtsK/SpoIIIE